MQTTSDPRHAPRLLRYAVQLFLILAFLTGGSSQVSGWDDTVVQLLALPLLAYALWRISGLPACPLRNVALAVAGLIALTPLLQLLHVPDYIWHLPEARQRLAVDLAAVGATPAFRWSLAPAATEAAFLFLLPPMAAFTATISTGPETHRGLLRAIMLLAIFSLVLGFAQLGVPRESLLNPFPRWAAKLNGVFANQNHQGISLVLAIIIGLSGMLTSIERVRDGLRQAWTPWLLGFVALFALCALPLTNSRASVLIAVFSVVAVPFALGFFSPVRLRNDWRARIGLACSLGLVALGAWGTAGWMQVAAVDELRNALRSSTLALGFAHAPLGSGIGTFVEAFEQSAPAEFVQPYYINHAHNEYLQWWVETGWLGIAVLIAALVALGLVAARALRSSNAARTQGVVALLGLLALLGHSWVDYPLRTVSLATVAAVLAGILVAQAGQRRIHHESRGTEPAAQ